MKGVITEFSKPLERDLWG